MLFLVAAIATLVAQLVAPPIVVGVVALVRRPRDRCGVRAAGLSGAAAGAGLFLLAWIAKQLALMAGLQPILGDGLAGSLLLHALGVGLLAGVAEESIRFGACSAIFRRAGRCRPLETGLLFGLGWGAMESALVGLRAASEFAQTLSSEAGAWAVNMPLLPLMSAVERWIAIVFHVSISAWAVRAASRSGGAARVGAFAAAVAVHAVVDAVVRAFYVPANVALEEGPASRALSLLVAMELAFAGLTAGTFAVAWRLKADPPGSPSPGS